VLPAAALGNPDISPVIEEFFGSEEFFRSPGT
jgi:hypothetical protein